MYKYVHWAVVNLFTFNLQFFKVNAHQFSNFGFFYCLLELSLVFWKIAQVHFWKKSDQTHKPWNIFITFSKLWMGGLTIWFYQCNQPSYDIQFTKCFQGGQVRFCFSDFFFVCKVMMKFSSFVPKDFINAIIRHIIFKESNLDFNFFRSHTDGVTCLQFNDFYIVSGSYDKTVKLWDFTVC